jgi:hypothetical protein
MSIPRIKTIVIAVLVVINVFFLTVYISDAAADAQNERKAIEDACELMRARGVMIEPGSVRTNNALRVVRTTRGLETEARIARAVLGETEMTDQGVIYLYENPERGTAEFYSAGDFEILLRPGAVGRGSDPQRAVRRVLQSMRIEASRFSLSSADGKETVTVVCTYRNADIFNCTLDFIFVGEDLEAIRGRYAADIETMPGSAYISSVGTAMIEFLAAVSRGDVECSSVHSIEAGYQQRVAGPFGEGTLNPAWLLSTDGGQYLFDSATREIRLLG